MRIKRRDPITVVIILVLLGLPAASRDMQQISLSPSQPGTLTFDAAVRFGQRDLPAGTYEFRCVHRGSYHLMTLYRVTSDASGRVVALGQPVATDYCRMEALREKVKASSARIKKDASGERVIHELRLEGEQVRHIFGEVLGFDRSERP